MAFVVEENEALDPVGVGLCGADGITLETYGVANAIRDVWNDVSLFPLKTDLRYSDFCFILCAIKIEAYYAGPPRKCKRWR
jgi:hypothetical protein